MHDNLIILTGGASSGMKKQASMGNLSNGEIQQDNERSKGLIEFGPNGRPLLDYLLLNAKKAGYKNIYIIIGKEEELIKDFYGNKDENNDFYGLNISFVIQAPQDRIKRVGTADALFQAVQHYPELNTQYYSICNSDNLLLVIIQRLPLLSSKRLPSERSIASTGA